MLHNWPPGQESRKKIQELCPLMVLSAQLINKSKVLFSCSLGPSILWSTQARTRQQAALHQGGANVSRGEAGCCSLQPCATKAMNCVEFLRLGSCCVLLLLRLNWLKQWATPVCREALRKAACCCCAISTPHAMGARLDVGYFGAGCVPSSSSHLLPPFHTPVWFAQHRFLFPAAVVLLLQKGYLYSPFFYCMKHLQVLAMAFRDLT